MENENDLLLDEIELEPIEHLVYKNNAKEELKNIFSGTKNEFKEKQIPSSWDEVYARFKIDQKVVDTFIDNIKTDVTIKKAYAYALLILLGLQLVSVNVIFFLRGFNIIKYSNQTFDIFITGALIEVIALVAIIVRYLFKDNISESLKNILEKNKHK